MGTNWRDLLGKLLLALLAGLCGAAGGLMHQACTGGCPCRQAGCGCTDREGTK